MMSGRGCFDLDIAAIIGEKFCRSRGACKVRLLKGRYSAVNCKAVDELLDVTAQELGCIVTVSM